MNEMLELIKTRRSVRAYQRDMVPRELIDQIVEAGLYAPSGMNRQPVIIIAVSDPKTRDALSRLNASIMGHGRRSVLRRAGRADRAGRPKRPDLSL